MTQIDAFGFTFREINNGTAYELVKYSGSESRLKIPPAYNGKPILRIAPYAFAGCSQITDLVISEGIVEIGDGAFQNCTSLVNLQIPTGSVKKGQNLCSGCSKLSNPVSHTPSPKPTPPKKHTSLAGVAIIIIIAIIGIVVVCGIIDNINDTVDKIVNPEPHYPVVYPTSNGYNTGSPDVWYVPSPTHITKATGSLKVTATGGCEVQVWVDGQGPNPKRTPCTFTNLPVGYIMVRASPTKMETYLLSDHSKAVEIMEGKTATVNFAVHKYGDII